MKMMTGGLLVLATFFATGMTGLTAQQARRGPHMRGMQGRQEGGGEQIMRMRERLELTEDQVNQLDAIRRENVQRRTAEMAEMTEVRSQYAAGLIQRSDVMAAMEDREATARGRDGQQHERLESILTEGQQETLNRLRRQNRVSADGRARGMRGRGGPGGFRGDRGGPPGRHGFRHDRGDRQGRSDCRRDRRGRHGG